MPVYKVREMPASELAGWFAHIKLTHEEAERARKKAEAKRRR